MGASESKEGEAVVSNFAVEQWKSQFNSAIVGAVVEEWRARYPKAKELNKEQLSTILSTPGIKAATHKSALTSPQAVHHLFTVLDTDGSGTISLYELISGLTILSTGTIEEKAALLFDAYDSDKNGELTPGELIRGLTTSLKAAAVICGQDAATLVRLQHGTTDEAEEAFRQHKLATATLDTAAMVNHIFEVCDANDDQRVTKQEWISQCIKDKALNALILTTTRDEKLYGKKEELFSNPDVNPVDAVRSLKMESPLRALEADGTHLETGVKKPKS